MNYPHKTLDCFDNIIKQESANVVVNNTFDHGKLRFFHVHLKEKGDTYSWEFHQNGFVKTFQRNDQYQFKYDEEGKLLNDTDDEEQGSSTHYMQYVINIIDKEF